jgi:uncharacterized protein (DUF983 family)
MSVTILTEPEKRMLLPAIGRGLRCKCPKCGEGSLFRAYLRVNDACPACGEELHHHRADDLPAYIAIVLVGHILGGVMLHLEMAYHVQPVVYLWTLLPLAIILPLALLPIIKGGVVGLQWAIRMHGFDRTTGEDRPDVDPGESVRGRA